jgi:hypothetical protein
LASSSITQNLANVSKEIVDFFQGFPELKFKFLASCAFDQQDPTGFEIRDTKCGLAKNLRVARAFEHDTVWYRF